MMDRKAVTRKSDGSNDERAVSPVIGVILMVAITVILAAVIATFVLGMGPGQSTVNAAVDVSNDGANNSTDVTIKVSDGGDADYIVAVNDSGSVVGPGEDANSGASYSGDDLGAGDSPATYTIYAITGSNLENGDSVDDAEAATEIGEFSVS